MDCRGVRVLSLNSASKESRSRRRILVIPDLSWCQFSPCLRIDWQSPFAMLLQSVASASMRRTRRHATIGLNRPASRHRRARHLARINDRSSAGSIPVEAYEPPPQAVCYWWLQQGSETTASVADLADRIKTLAAHTTTDGEPPARFRRFWSPGETRPVRHPPSGLEASWPKLAHMWKCGHCFQENPTIW